MSETTTTLKERFEKEYWFWDKRFDRENIYWEIQDWIRAIDQRFDSTESPIGSLEGGYEDEFDLRITVFDLKTRSLTGHNQYTEFLITHTYQGYEVVIQDEVQERSRKTVKTDDELRDYLFTEVMSTLEGFQISY